MHKNVHSSSVCLLLDKSYFFLLLLKIYNTLEVVNVDLEHRFCIINDVFLYYKFVNEVKDFITIFTLNAVITSLFIIIYFKLPLSF